MKSLQDSMAARLLIVMVLVTDICGAVLLEKSTAFDFLQKIREKRGLECFPGGCSTEVSEAEEQMEVNVQYEESSSLMYNNAAAKKEINDQKPANPPKETMLDEGSGM